MDNAQLIRDVQKLANDAGLDHNSMRPVQAMVKLDDLRILLNEELPAPEPEKDDEQETAQEQEDSEQEEATDADDKELRPEAQPSEE